MGRRRNTVRAVDAGFGLVELIVVIVLMGILAAIMVPSYVGLQGSVARAATMSDLGSDRDALVAYSIDNNGLVPASSGFDPSSSGSNLTGYGWGISDQTVSYRYFTNSGRTSWCLEMTNTTGTVLRVSPNKSAGEGTCAALGPSSY